MENKKTGTAKIDINEYDRLMKIERESKKEIEELVVFLKRFLLAFDRKNGPKSIELINETMRDIDYSIEIKTNNGNINVGSGSKKLFL